MEIKIFIACLSLLVLVSGQGGMIKSYDWRTTGRLQEWPKLTSLTPYERHAVTETYPVIPDPHRGSPIDYPVDSRPYQEDSYSAEYHGPSPYQYADQSQSSYEQPYGNTPQEELNMSVARIGGFAGSGDTRGFGAYDYPKNNHHDEDHHGRTKLHSELSDLLKIGRNHHNGYHDHDSMLVHPMPPPL